MRKICCKYSPSHKTLKRTPVGLGAVIKNLIFSLRLQKNPLEKKASELLLCCIKDFEVIKEVLECHLIKSNFHYKEGCWPEQFAFLHCTAGVRPGSNNTHRTSRLPPRSTAVHKQETADADHKGGV